jgi:hypothetical protein
MKNTAPGEVQRFYYRQTTYDYYQDRDLTMGLSETALQDLFGRILLPPQGDRRDYQHGSFLHIGRLNRFVVIVPTAGIDRVLVSGIEVQVWLSAKSLAELITGCTQSEVQVLCMAGPGGRPKVTVMGERDGFEAACVLWALLPEGHAKY